MAAFACAESCTTAGEIDKQYTPEGECSYKTEKRICCDDKTWSEWKNINDGEVDKNTDCPQPPSPPEPEGSDCTFGQTPVQYGYTIISGSEGIIGIKYAKQMCNNNNHLEYIDDHVTCTKGYAPYSNSYGRKACSKFSMEPMEEVATGRDFSNFSNNGWSETLPGTYWPPEDYPNSPNTCTAHGGQFRWMPIGYRNDYCKAYYLYCIYSAAYGTEVLSLTTTGDFSYKFSSELPGFCSGRVSSCNNENDIGKCSIRQSGRYGSEQIENGYIKCGSSKIWNRCTGNLLGLNDNCSNWGDDTKWEDGKALFQRLTQQ